MTEQRQEILEEAAKEALLPGFAIYDLQVHHSKKGVRVVVFLDKLTDPNGSPTIEDCEAFSTRFRAAMEEKAQEGVIESDMAVDVSSPGAERELRTDEEILRFADKPLSVLFEEENGRNTRSVWMLDKLGASEIQFKAADLKRRPAKSGRQKNGLCVDRKKIKKINLYLDF